MKRFLYLHRGALGDFVLSMPALRMIRTEFPNVEFIGIGKTDHLKLATEFSLCEKMLNCESAIFAKFLEGEEIPKCIKDVDRAVLWLKNGKKVSSLLSNAGCKTLLIDPFAKIANHVGEIYFHKIASFLFPYQKKELSDYLPKSESNSIKNIITIHPGSGSRSKNMPPDFYIQIACEFRKLKMDCRFVLGPAEFERGEEKFFPLEKSIYPADSVELKNVILNSRLFIGNDSGPSHLAGFCGIPTIAIFAKTPAKIWKPIGRKVVVVNSDGIRIARIVAEAKKLITL